MSDEKQPTSENSLQQFDVGTIKANWPRNLSYSSKDDIKKYYSTFGAVKLPHSFFYEKMAVDIFLMAMAIGKDIGTITPIRGGKVNNLPTQSLTDAAIWAMISIALSEEGSDLNTLEDGTEIFRICEGYANTGINTLITLDNTGEVGNWAKRFEEKFEKHLE